MSKRSESMTPWLKAGVPPDFDGTYEEDWPMARGLLVLMLVLCATLAIFAEAQGAASQSTLIIPGMQIGPVRIGMGFREVVQVLGTPTRTNRGFPYWTAEWQSFWAAFDSVYLMGDVVSISTRSPRYTTTQGIRVGSRPSDVLTKLGPPNDYEHIRRGGTIVGVYYYNKLRIEFAGQPQIRTDWTHKMIGRVTAIVVDGI